jgi:CDP-diacylglycerol--glycerol-3-phosphate 3-phosphatidyltransferase
MFSEARAPRMQHNLRGRVVSSGETPASSGNLANVITVIRILLAPAFIWMLLADNGELGPLRYLAAALFLVAIITDGIDGSLARRRNLVTDLGKLLDPIADKVLIGGALIGLNILGELPWWVTVVVMLREVGITVWRFFALRDRVIPASTGGKLKTIVQAVAISFALVPVSLLLGDWVISFNVGLMTVAVLLTVFTGIEYLWQARKAAPAGRS